VSPDWKYQSIVPEGQNDYIWKKIRRGYIYVFIDITKCTYMRYIKYGKSSLSIVLA